MKRMNILQNQPGQIPQLADFENANSSYELLTKHIGGTIDCFRHKSLSIWVDDEGLLKELDVNIVIKRSMTNNITDMDTVLVGPAVFTSIDDEGATVSLTPEAQQIINNFETVYLGEKKILLLRDFN